MISHLPFSLCGAQGLGAHYYFNTGRFNLRAFWADHRTILPIHHAVYMAEVGCKKAAAANVESVFSGSGKFTKEAPATGPTLLSRVVKCHYNWKYKFLRPSIDRIIRRYNDKFNKATSTSTAPTEPSGTQTGPQAG